MDQYPFDLSVLLNLSHFGNMTFIEGTTGHQISWTAFSMFPAHYEIYQDGDLVVQDTWNGSAIVYMHAMSPKNSVSTSGEIIYPKGLQRLKELRMTND